MCLSPPHPRFLCWNSPHGDGIRRWGLCWSGGVIRSQAPSSQNYCPSKRGLRELPSSFHYISTQTEVGSQQPEEGPHQNQNTRAPWSQIPRLQSLRSEAQLLTSCLVCGVLLQQPQWLRQIPREGLRSGWPWLLDMLNETGLPASLLPSPTTAVQVPGTCPAGSQSAPRSRSLGITLVLCSHSHSGSARSLPNSGHGLCYALVFFSLLLDHCLPRGTALSMPWSAMDQWAAAPGPCFPSL